MKGNIFTLAMLAIGLVACATVGISTNKPAFHIYNQSGKVIEQVNLPDEFIELAKDDTERSWMLYGEVSKPRGCTVIGDILLFVSPSICGPYTFNMLALVTSDTVDILAIARITTGRPDLNIVYWYGGHTDGTKVNEEQFNQYMKSFLSRTSV